ncbi:MAG: signal peptidase II [Acidimicrobiia bacterium]
MPNGVADDPTERARAGPRGRRLAWCVVVAVVVTDQLTKAWAVSALDDGPISIIGTTIELRLGYNSGAAFSLFGDYGVVLALLAIAMVVVLVRMVHRSKDVWMIGALALVLGGALGNLADRMFRAPGFLRGAVVDFVHIDPIPTFNVADAALTVGAVTLVLAGFFGDRRVGDTMS